MAMEMKRRQFLTASVATAGVALLAACAPKAAPTVAPAPKEEAPKAEATKAEAPQPAAQEKINLTLSMRAGGEQSEAPFYIDRPKELMEEYPNITVELVPIPASEYYTKVQTMAAAGSLADVVFSEGEAGQQNRHSANGLLLPSQEWLDANGHSTDEWFPAAIRSLTYEGTMYGLPKSANPARSFLFFNQDMLDEAGIPVPTKHDGCTHEQVTEWSDKLTKGDESMRDVFGMSIELATTNGIYSRVRAFGTYGVNDDGTRMLTDTPEFYEAVKWINGFYQRKQVPLTEGLPSGGVPALFGAGKLALRLSARYEWKPIKAAVEAAEKPFTWAVVEAPREPNAKAWPASVDSHDPSTQTKHAHEAFLLSYALADKRMAELATASIGYCTARVDDEETIAAMDDADPTKEWLQLQFENQAKTESFHQPKNLRGPEVQSIMVNSLDQLWLGQEELTPDFMKKLTADCQAILDKPL